MTTHSFTSITFTLIPRFMRETYTHMEDTLLDGSLSTYLVVTIFRLIFFMCYSFAIVLSLGDLYLFSSVTHEYSERVLGLLVHLCCYMGMNHLIKSNSREILGNEGERESLV
ncbi:MAG: hypothetical protein JOS17DRAFT_772078 [Linnemannia elongata]|nr:MAG: hypothetical protein JOS17DRAFT_772078 [Linnemannia elongata]